MPLGMEVGLGAGHIVTQLPPRARKGQRSPLFLAYVYCGDGRPSQLLLSSCLYMLPAPVARSFCDSSG